MITGTLQELNAQVGDVVRAIRYPTGAEAAIKTEWTIKSVDPWYADPNDNFKLSRPNSRLSSKFIFELISRAKLKLWGEMTDEEQGALLLARHRGQTIEFSSGGRTPWKKLEWDFDWLPEHAYRVCAVNTVTIGGHHDTDHGWLFGETYDTDTHDLTFTVDGNEPVTGVFTNQAGATITLEKING